MVIWNRKLLNTLQCGDPCGTLINSVDMDKYLQGFASYNFIPLFLLNINSSATLSLPRGRGSSTMDVYNFVQKKKGSENYLTKFP